jgi:hypothetical protein
MNFLDLILCGIAITILAQSMYTYSIYKNLKRKYERVIRPLYLRYKFIRKTKKGRKMALVYEVSCAAPVSDDVVSRVLTVSVNGQEVSVANYIPSATNLGELVFEQDDNVVLSLVDVDDAGNKSEATVLEFVALDTVAPESPTGLGVKLVREE